MAAIFMWFAIWLYPNSLMYGSLPLNIRLDDMFLSYACLVCLWRSRGCISSGVTIKLALAWFIIQLVGNLAGAFLSDSNIYGIVKFMSKSAYVPMTVIIISYALRDKENIQYIVKWICIAGVAASLLGVATVYKPQQFSIFIIPQIGLSTGSYVDALEDVSELSRRAVGSIGIVGTALILLNISLLALSILVFGKKGTTEKWLFGVCFAFCTLGLIYTQTRGAMIAFAAAFLWGLVCSKRRGTFGILLALGTLVIALQGGLIQIIVARFIGETGSTLGGGANVRMGIWEMFIHNFQPIHIPTGVGMYAAYNIYKATAHNTYLGSFIYGGMLGFALLIVVIYKTWNLSGRLLKHHGDLTAIRFGTYLRMLIISMLVVGCSSENFQDTLCMQLFFTGMLIAERYLVLMPCTQRDTCKQVFEHLPHTDYAAAILY